MAYKFTDDNFEQEVLKSDIPVLVDFYADWCGPCKMIGPVIEELAEEYEGVIKICKINVDENQNYSTKYKVMTIPNLKFFKNGEKVDQVIGVVSKDQLVEKLEALK
ncbi:MAG: thioredoxin [Clostridiales bacterium]|nr:thioredoxin [Clostridiales bacterium]